MNSSKLAAFLASLVVVIIVFYSSFFIVNEGQQAIITRFGKPVRDPIQKAGGYFKYPFMEDVMYLEKRILSWDGDPNQIPTLDKKYISVDTTARWKIIDPLKFIQSVQSERGAQARINNIIDAITRDTISNHNLVEAVRNSNSILEEADKINKAFEQGRLDVVGVQTIEEIEIVGDLDKIKIGREELSQIITKRTDEELRSYGIEVIDVQLRRIFYEKNVENKVFERMISERQRIAEKIRATGKGEKARIEGRMNKDLQEIQSLAYKKAQVIRGKAEARAMEIYTESLSKAPEFYSFIKSMDTYKKIFKQNTKLILSTDSALFKYLSREK